MQESLAWHGILDQSLVDGPVVQSWNRLADAAKVGDWSTVLNMLDEPSHPPNTNHQVDANQWRPGGKSLFTVLHQAAWHGAPTDVVSELIERGALRSLKEAHGRTAYDIAVEHDHPDDLRQLLLPPPSPLTTARIRALDTNLAQVIDGRVQELYPDRDLRKILRYPSVEVFHEAPDQRVWFAIPGMYGGFDMRLRQGYVETLSWCRVAGGSGQAHVITHEGAILVDEGFV
ncbi:MULTISPECIES: ankyrin repeat domain-containing protein [unclassified Mycobacterium]|uniref:ankyrin repeat domain-containing protein n=1 Tax=unclassified Mycobacterium TaxID=2642494 RepID=UPI0008014369|nr:MULTISPECIES: ankyrin repeat domain-containing protein [unclassified Mycobacterium]OBG73566.1 hypothetical protein A5700_06585 [Mycobacterium sp. E1214]OBH22604.1 hypothetical protein A5693_13250 [Mycobacterium sp. E1319]